MNPNRFLECRLAGLLFVLTSVLSAGAQLSVRVGSDGSDVILKWDAQPGKAYCVLTTDEVGHLWLKQSLFVTQSAQASEHVERLQIQSAGCRFYSIAQYQVSPSLSISRQTNLTLSGLYITNKSGPGIVIRDSKNVTIANCFLGPCSGVAISIENSEAVAIVSNRFNNVASGVYALTSTGVRVLFNCSLNVQGPMPRGQFAQFDKVNGPGSCINSNLSQNVLGESHPEDAINIYQSNGSSDDPIQVIGNEIRGGGPSNSGGGIMIGDGGGSNIIVALNTLVDPGQYGIAIAGGTKVQVISNKIYASRQPFTNVGVYVWNQYAVPCHSHTVNENQVLWFNSAGVENPFWNSGNCGSVIGSGNNWHAELDAEIIPDRLF